MALKSRVITISALLSTSIIVAAILWQLPRSEILTSKAQLQVSDSQRETLRRLEESLIADGVSDVSIIATEAFTIETMPELLEGLHALVVITSSTDSLAGYFDYVWHRSLLMREAILVSQANPAPLILGEVRILNRAGKLIDTFYTGNQMQPSAQKKYFTEAPKSEIDDDATKKLLLESVKPNPNAAIKDIQVRSGGPSAAAQRVEVFVVVKSIEDPRIGLDISGEVMAQSSHLNQTLKTSLTTSVSGSKMKRVTPLHK
ncbi:MAG: hypothetical protein HC853_05440 [Anaerolineae bacterium]|nr:hypothetical protein [Anaerolineae bacterium]